MHLPGEQIGRETPLQERRRTRLVLLRREELEAVCRMEIVEVLIDVRAADNEEAAIEDSDGRWVPAALQQMQRLRVFEKRATIARR